MIYFVRMLQCCKQHFKFPIMFHYYELYASNIINYCASLFCFETLFLAVSREHEYPTVGINLCFHQRNHHKPVSDFIPVSMFISGFSCNDIMIDASYWQTLYSFVTSPASTVKCWYQTGAKNSSGLTVNQWHPADASDWFILVCLWMVFCPATGSGVLARFTDLCLWRELSEAAVWQNDVWEALRVWCTWVWLQARPAGSKNLLEFM